MFLTTKMWPRDYGYDTALEAARVSLTKLDTDYLGKLNPLRRDSWLSFQKTYQMGE